MWLPGRARDQLPLPKRGGVEVGGGGEKGEGGVPAGAMATWATQIPAAGCGPSPVSLLVSPSGGGARESGDGRWCPGLSASLPWENVVSLVSLFHSLIHSTSFH